MGDKSLTKNKWIPAHSMPPVNTSGYQCSCLGSADHAITRTSALPTPHGPARWTTLWTAKGCGHRAPLTMTQTVGELSLPLAGEGGATVEACWVCGVVGVRGVCGWLCVVSDCGGAVAEKSNHCGAKVQICDTIFREVSGL